jgi:exodeoxyribonuclease V alpha subunit
MTGEAATPRESVQGVLERITFRNAETHFTVGKLKATGKSDLVTIVGTLAGVNEGEWLRCEGRFETSREYGPQFRIEAFEASTPETAYGIEKYLGSGIVPGIGGEIARRIVARFGEDTLRVIEKEPRRLFEVEGIGPKRQAQIVRAWDEHRALRRVMVFLRGHGVGAAHAARIHKAYGERAVERVTENPYRLAHEVFGIGFQTADRIARSLGVPADSPRRADAGVQHVLAELSGEGHVCVPRRAAVEKAAAILGLAKEAIEAAVSREIARGALVEERRPARAADAEPWLYLRHLHAAEAGLAAGLSRLLRAPRGLPPIKSDLAIDWVEKRRGISLAPSQREALKLALDSKIAVITGGPGVGKTTIVAALLDIVEAKGARARLAAPTGRAAKRLEEATGREAKTIHRLLKWNPRTADFEHGADHPIDGDLLILDECSMIDLPLMQRTVAALKPSAHLIVVGDRDQLPSVGPGNVLSDLVASGALPVARLTEIFRQARESRIVVNAHRINRGELPELLPLPEGEGRGAPASDFYFAKAEDPLRAVERIKWIVRDFLPRRLGVDPLRDVQVLAPMHRGDVGVRALNEELQRLLGCGRGPAVTRAGRTFAAGDKVIQLQNDYEKEVYNGDVGIVERIDEEAAEIAVRYDEERLVRYSFSDLDELELAYAVSIHKSQGSEYRCVVIPLLTQHYVMLQRNLLYTAITRGKRCVVIVGQPRAVAIAVKNDETRRRGSFLAERLRDR